MDGDTSKGASPFFLPGHAGNLFTLYHRPAGPAGCRGGVLYVHPFANEMNYTRRAAALLARALAGRGWGVLQVDLFGCGDSDGDFRDASWETWVDDLTTAFGWLQERVGGRVGLVGIRLGGLLALDFTSRARRNIDRVLLWHPVVNGQQMMTDFLRLRLLSDAIGERVGESATTQELRQKIDSGEPVEVVGYEIMPHLGKPSPRYTSRNWGSPPPPQSGGSRSCREPRIPAVRWHKLPYMPGKRRDARRLSTSSLASILVVSENPEFAGHDRHRRSDIRRKPLIIAHDRMRPRLLSSTPQGIVEPPWWRARLAFTRYHTMQPDVSAVKMASEGSILYGVVHDPRSTAKRGVLMVAAGAYRVGPHRQFLLLVRDWAADGIPVMRFDYQGQGDSEGAGAFNFDSLMHDIRSAIDCFTSAVPGIERVVLWGLCEAALNSLLYARRDPRVDGLVLVNPADRRAYRRIDSAQPAGIYSPIPRGAKRLQG